MSNSPRRKAIKRRRYLLKLSTHPGRRTVTFRVDDRGYAHMEVRVHDTPKTVPERAVGAVLQAMFGTFSTTPNGDRTYTHTMRFE